MDKEIFKTKKFVTNSIYFKKVLALKLSLEEFIMLTYFDNDYEGYLDLDKLSTNTGIPMDDAYKIFNSLISKKLIRIESTKDADKRMVEKVNLDNFYELVNEDRIASQKKQEKKDIYALFEQEFGRTISSMEYEIINAWLEKNFSEELIEAALKEAVYNGVKNFRYIDKILYEWQKKGFKKTEDVNNHLMSRETTKEKELFDYNWLDDEE